MSSLTWTTEKVDVKKLTGFDGNPRDMSEKMHGLLKGSLETFGQVKPLIVDVDFTVIGGNQRLQHLTGEVWVSVPSRKLTKEERKEFALIANNSVGDWDWDKLFDLGWSDDMLIESFGFDEEMLSDVSFDLDNLDFSDLEDNRVIKKLLVNFGDEDVTGVLAEAHRATGISDANELLLHCCKINE